MLEGLARVLEQDGEFEYIGATASISEALDAVRERQPDVLLVDQSAGLKQIFQFVSDVKSTRAPLLSDPVDKRAGGNRLFPCAAIGRARHSEEVGG